MLRLLCMAISTQNITKTKILIKKLSLYKKIRSRPVIRRKIT
jgi:hypothetical protein